MAKYTVEVGGFVSTYRQRTFTVYADSEEAACDKARDKFVELQQRRAGNMCDGGYINSVKKIGAEF